MISVLILTFNEEKNIRHCLDSVRWSDDIVVVDSFSSDRTVDFARAAGARVLQNPFVDFAAQRNFGIRHGTFKYDWVFHLDADEVVTTALKQELFQAAANQQMPAYRIPFKLIFQGRWLRHAGMFPSYQVRFGRRDALEFIQVGHGQRESLPAAQVGTLKQPLLHYSFSKGLEEWFAKHNRYSTSEAEANVRALEHNKLPWRELLAANSTTRRRALKSLSIRLPFRPLMRFLYMYLLRRGCLDGVAGLRYCKMLSIYESMIVLKVKELQGKNLEHQAKGTPFRPLQGGPNE